jgi:hypothetical protein
MFRKGSAGLQPGEIVGGKKGALIPRCDFSKSSPGAPADAVVAFAGVDKSSNYGRVPARGISWPSLIRIRNGLGV